MTDHIILSSHDGLTWVLGPTLIAKSRREAVELYARGVHELEPGIQVAALRAGEWRPVTVTVESRPVITVAAPVAAPAAAPAATSEA